MIYALWSKLWSRSKGMGVVIHIPFGFPDASNDKCQAFGGACGLIRKFHRRNSDHRFVEQENRK